MVFIRYLARRFGSCTILLLCIILFCLLSINKYLEVQACPREISRNVKSILQKEVYKRMKIEPEELPDDCHLNPNFDKYFDQESNKIKKKSRGEFLCNYCGKRFVNEFYIDRHMDNKHADRLQSNRTVCLADLCPILGCSSKPTDSRNSHRKSNKDRYANLGPSFRDVEPCSENEVERNKYLCEGLIRRCFSELSGGEELGDHFRKHFCNKLHCENGILVGAPQSTLESGGESFFVLHFVQVLVICMVIAFTIIYATAVGSWRRLIGLKTEIISPMQRSSKWASSFFQSTHFTKKTL